jgi:hypothetical protein
MPLPGAYACSDDVVHWQAKILQQVGARPIQGLSNRMTSGFTRIDANDLEARFCQVQTRRFSS